MIRLDRSAASLAAALTLALAVPAAAQPAPSSREVDRRFAVSATAGILFPGTITVGDYDFDTNAGFNLRAAADFFVSPHISMGPYLQYATASASDADVDVAMIAIGGQLVGRFGPTSGGHFRAGIGFAYQIESVDASGMEDATGFGISPFLEYVYPVGQASWFGHVGFTSQPSGGNKDVDVTWGPIFTIAVGAEFGQ
jgi:hypothetical protein